MAVKEKCPNTQHVKHANARGSGACPQEIFEKNML